MGKNTRFDMSKKYYRLEKFINYCQIYFVNRIDEDILFDFDRELCPFNLNFQTIHSIDRWMDLRKVFKLDDELKIFDNINCNDIIKYICLINPKKDEIVKSGRLREYYCNLYNKLILYLGARHDVMSDDIEKYKRKLNFIDEYEKFLLNINCSDEMELIIGNYDEMLKLFLTFDIHPSLEEFPIDLLWYKAIIGNFISNEDFYLNILSAIDITYYYDVNFPSKIGLNFNDGDDWNFAEFIEKVPQIEKCLVYMLNNKLIFDVETWEYLYLGNTDGVIPLNCNNQYMLFSKFYRFGGRFPALFYKLLEVVNNPDFIIRINNKYYFYYDGKVMESKFFKFLLLPYNSSFKYYYRYNEEQLYFPVKKDIYEYMKERLILCSKEATSFNCVPSVYNDLVTKKINLTDVDKYDKVIKIYKKDKFYKILDFDAFIISKIMDIRLQNDFESGRSRDVLFIDNYYYDYIFLITTLNVFSIDYMFIYDNYALVSQFNDNYYHKVLDFCYSM